MSTFELPPLTTVLGRLLHGARAAGLWMDPPPRYDPNRGWVAACPLCDATLWLAHMSVDGRDGAGVECAAGCHGLAVTKVLHQNFGESRPAA